MPHFKLALPRIVSRFSIAAAIGLTGCSAGFTNQNPAQAGPTQGSPFHGTAMGGEQPLANAQIYFYATGSTGYGSSSRSLLVAPNGSNNTVYDGNGLYYVLTGPTGNFSITGDYTCPSPDSQVYLLSKNGNAGAGNNTAASLIATLGSCGNLSSSTFVVLNEVTTVAAIASLQQFTKSSTQIGSTTTNQAGIEGAFATINNLVNFSYGGAQISTSTRQVPDARIYSMANALAACVNSTGPSSPACTRLFAAAVPPAGGTTATDTFSAMLNIAKNPGGNPAGIFAISPASPPYPVMLASAPNDYSLSIGFTGGGLQTPTSVAVDGAGNIWIANCGANCGNTGGGADDVVEMNYSGQFISGSGFGSGSVNHTQGFSIDQGNYVWSVNAGRGSPLVPSLSILQPSGLDAAASPRFTGMLSTPKGIGIDPNGNAWIANSGSQSVVQVSNNGVFSTPTTLPHLAQPTDVVIDSNGHVIVSDFGPSSTGGIEILQQADGSEVTYSTAGAAHPSVLALDAGHNIWELDSTTAQIYDLTSTGAAGTAAGTGISIPNTYQIQSMAIDGLGNVFVPSCYTTCTGVTTDPADAIFILTNTGTELTSAKGLQSPSLSNPVSIAFDESGNAWVANAGNGFITEFIGIAAPVQTPIASAVSNGTIGIRP
jgi:streptogramin lyase